MIELDGISLMSASSWHSVLGDEPTADDKGISSPTRKGRPLKVLQD